MTILQGIIAGSAAAYLRDLEKKHTCTRVAQQVNHALLLIAETIRFAGSPLGAFGTTVKVLGAMTYAAVLADFFKGDALLSEETMSIISKIYQVCVVGASTATLILGNPAFAISTFSVLALDTYLENKSEIFSLTKRIGGFISLIGYGAMSMAAKGVLANLNTLSAFIVGIESFSKIEFIQNIFLNVIERGKIYFGSCHHGTTNDYSEPKFESIAQTINSPSSDDTSPNNSPQKSYDDSNDFPPQKPYDDSNDFPPQNNWNDWSEPLPRKHYDDSSNYQSQKLDNSNQTEAPNNYSAPSADLSAAEPLCKKIGKALCRESIWD